MVTFFQTREGVKKRIQEITAWIASVLVGTGVALILTVMFAGAGIALFLLGLGVLAIGRLSSLIFPALFRYESRLCPYCQSVNQVHPRATDYLCSRCSQHVAIRGMAKAV